MRVILLALAITLPGFAQRLRSDLAFGGSGNDSVRAAAVDSAGNIYVVGTTASFDFPLRSAFQTTNSGTQLIVSTDAGITWKPLGTPFPSSTPLRAPVIAVDPTDSQIVYAASGNRVCKSTDGARQFNCVTVAFASSQAAISSLAIDPKQPLTIYASVTVDGGVYKSVDGGQTWADASQGLPAPLLSIPSRSILFTRTFFTLGRTPAATYPRMQRPRGRCLPFSGRRAWEFRAVYLFHSTQ